MKKILLGVIVLALPIISFANSSSEGRETPRYCSNTGSTISTGAVTEKDDDCNGINTGALIEASLKALQSDISKLTAAQKLDISALIRNYLTAQGITPTTPKMNDGTKKLSQEALQAKREALKESRKARLDAFKVKRDALKNERKRGTNTHASRSNSENE